LLITVKTLKTPAGALNPLKGMTRIPNQRQSGLFCLRD